MVDDAKTLLLPVDRTDVRRSQIVRSVVSSALRSRRSFFFLLGPLLCGVICLWVKVDGPKSSRNMLAVLAWVLSWWVTEAVPLPIASLAPLFLFPLFGIAPADEVAKSYMDDVITMVLGSFIFALAVEQYNIHKRLALNITLLFCGEPVKPSLLILGICATSAFVSMWMHNVAAAVLMMPVATGILQRFPSHAERDATVDNFCQAVVLAVVYSVAIGGMSTLTGTGVNLILVGMWKSYFPEAEPITFNVWLAFGLPLALLLLFLLWGILCVRYCSGDQGPAISEYLDKAHLKEELRLLGPMEFAEKTILTVFSVLIALWMTRSITDEVPGWSTLFDGRVGDGTVSVMMATLLFIIPSMKKKGENLMDWSKCKKLPWNIILLLGAGLALADGVRSTGLADVLAGGLDFLEYVPRWAVVPLIGLGSSILTEFISSNNAVVLLLLPWLVEVARTLGVHPLSLMVPGAVAAQFAFVLPTATPSNSVGFITGHVEVKDMIKTGFFLKVGGVVLLALLVPTLGNILLRLKGDANSA